MQKAIIQLTYRQIIDASSETDFGKKVLHFSYEEYKMKSQAYNTDGTVATFTELKAKDDRANSLHYKSGFAIGGLIDGLKNKIPVLKDALGQDVDFDTYKFELIETDITNKLSHKVAIHFITGWITLYEIIGDTLLLSKNNDLEAGFPKPADTFMLKMQRVGICAVLTGVSTVDTFMLKMQPGLSISNYQEFPIFKHD